MTNATDEFDTPEDEENGVQDLDAPAQEGRPNDDPDVAAEPSPEDTDENPNKREARYRLQLREAQLERDQLRANVEALQRAEVERLAGGLIQKPGALWSADVELAALLDDAGRVDPDKVDAAARAALDTLGLAPTRPRNYVRGEGSNPRAAADNAWEGAFKG